MGRDVGEIAETPLPPPHSVKVHVQMCTGLRKLVDSGNKILPQIEAVRPGGSSGVQALCLLSKTIEKATSVIQDCCDSSKLYLAITGDVILSRCKKAMKTFNHSLSQIQYLVPVMMAAEISRIICDLSDVTFGLDPSEEEAGKVLKTLLQQYASAMDSTEDSVIQSIQIAAFRLQITSPKAILIEKRSIKRLLDGDSVPQKKRILTILLNLLKKYEKFTARRKLDNVGVEPEDSSNSMNSPDQFVEIESRTNYGPDESRIDMLSRSTPPEEFSVEIESHTNYGPDESRIDMLSRPTPPEEFRCPLSSKVMYDPVVIDSGQTFERMFIQKWFSEGHDTCPKTKRKLSHLSVTPNATLKDLISKWCITYGMTILDPFMQSKAIHSQDYSLTSIASLSNSLCNLDLPNDFSNVSLGYLDSSQTSESSSLQIIDRADSMFIKTNGNSNTYRTNPSYHTRDEYLHNLDALSWDSQCKLVEDFKIHFKDDSQSVQFSQQEYFIEPLIKFLEKALNFNDVKAQRAGCLLLLAFVTKSRSSGQYLNEGVYVLLSLFFDSEVIEEAICIMEVLSYYRDCRTKIAASGVTSSIIRIIEIQIRELCEPAIRILYNLSLDSESHSYIVSAAIVSKLVPYLEDGSLARYCIAIIRNLCDHDIIRVSVAETDGCISSIAKMLETDSCENQEHAVFVLLSLCSQRDLYCQLVMDEGVIPSLVSISINGNDKAKASALELLRLFRVLTDNNMQEYVQRDQNLPRDSGDDVEEQKPSSKPRGFFRKIAEFSKSTPKKKR